MTLPPLPSHALASGAHPTRRQWLQFGLQLSALGLLTPAWLRKRLVSQ